MYPPINIVIELFLLVLGWVDDVNQLNDESQENQNCEYNNHVGETNGKRAWSCHVLIHLSICEKLSFESKNKEPLPARPEEILIIDMLLNRLIVPAD